MGEAESDVEKLSGYLGEWGESGRIIIVPSEAVDGSDNEKLYYALDLFSQIYGNDKITEADLDKAYAELFAE